MRRKEVEEEEERGEGKEVEEGEGRESTDKKNELYVGRTCSY